jgi:HTH-type transcriptional regulator/antitoxin HigA
MTIKNEKQYKEYEAQVEGLIQKGTELGDMELLSEAEKAEFTMLSEALDHRQLHGHKDLQYKGVRLR